MRVTEALKSLIFNLNQCWAYKIIKNKFLDEDYSKRKQH